MLANENITERPLLALNLQPRIVMVTATITNALKGLIKLESDARSTDSSNRKTVDESKKLQSQLEQLVKDPSHYIFKSCNSKIIDAIRNREVLISKASLTVDSPTPASKYSSEIRNSMHSVGTESGSLPNNSSFHSRKLDFKPPRFPNQHDDNILEPMVFQVLQLSDVNQALPHVKHIHLDITWHSSGTVGTDYVKSVGVDSGAKNNNKLDILSQVLRDTLQSYRYQKGRIEERGCRIIVFCNTITSCRAVDYHLRSVFPQLGNSNSKVPGAVELLSYHGDLNSTMRTHNLLKYRSASQSNSLNSDEEMLEAHTVGCALQGSHKVLICTDIAARGLDMPDTEHVIMFDFPLNAVDYLHRLVFTIMQYIFKMLESLISCGNMYQELVELGVQEELD
jgi:hypothetical protein